MYNTEYLSELFNVSATTVRVHLRKLGYGVGMAGTYEFSEGTIGQVVAELSYSLGREPSSNPQPDIMRFNLGGLVTPEFSLYNAVRLEPSVSGSVGNSISVTRGPRERVTSVLVENKRNILLIVLALLSAVIGVDLAL